MLLQSVATYRGPDQEWGWDGGALIGGWDELVLVGEL